jgi:hypothetical protein
MRLMVAASLDGVSGGVERGERREEGHVRGVRLGTAVHHNVAAQAIHVEK